MTENAILNDFLQQLATIVTKQSQHLDICHDKLLSRNQVCELLNINRQTLAKWIKAGKFPKPVIIGISEERWTNHMINQRIYEDNPHLHKGDEVMADAISLVDEMEAVA